MGRPALALLALVARDAAGYTAGDDPKLTPADASASEHPGRIRATQAQAQNGDFSAIFDGCEPGYTWFQDEERAHIECNGQCCAACCPAPPNTVWGTEDCQWKEKFPMGAKIGFVHVGKTGGSTIGAWLGVMTADAISGGKQLNISELHTSASHIGGGLDRVWDLLIISTRDPVDRTVSAFNYELEATRESLQPVPLLQKLQDCFPNPGNATAGFTGAVDDFARSLIDMDSECGKVARRCLIEDAEYGGPFPKNDHYDHESFRDVSYCGHLNANHKHYLTAWRNIDNVATRSQLNAIRSGRTHAFIVRDGQIEENMADVYNWLCLPPDQWDPARFNPGDVVPNAWDMGVQPRHQDTLLSVAGRQALANSLVQEYQLLETLEDLVDNGNSGGNQTMESPARVDRGLWEPPSDAPTEPVAEPAAAPATKRGGRAQSAGRRR
jgi:hypothetical protein